MTIAIGINAGLYAILAADTRTTYYHPRFPSTALFHDDNKSKIQKTTVGLIIGAGFVQLLDLVNNRLATETITNTNATLSVIKESLEEIRKRWKHYPMIDTAIAQTGWILSYYTYINDIPTLRLGAYHDDLNSDNFVLYAPGDSAIIYPVEITEQAVKTIHPEIINTIVIPSDQSEIQSSIQNNIAKLVVLIQALFPYCESISSRFQVGIHLDGKVGISEIIDISDEKYVSGFNIKLE